MKIRIDNLNNCLYCGRKLSFFHLFRDLYCNNSHRSAYAREFNDLALSRLLTGQKSLAEIRSERCERRVKAEELRSSQLMEC